METTFKSLIYSLFFFVSAANAIETNQNKAETQQDENINIILILPSDGTGPSTKAWGILEEPLQQASKEYNVEFPTKVKSIDWEGGISICYDISSLPLTERTSLAEEILDKSKNAGYVQAYYSPYCFYNETYGTVLSINIEDTDQNSINEISQKTVDFITAYEKEENVTLPLRTLRLDVENAIIESHYPDHSLQYGFVLHCFDTSAISNKKRDALYYSLMQFEEEHRLYDQFNYTYNPYCQNSPYHNPILSIHFNKETGRINKDAHDEFKDFVLDYEKEHAINLKIRQSKNKDDTDRRAAYCFDGSDIPPSTYADFSFKLRSLLYQYKMISIEYESYCSSDFEPYLEE